MAGIKPEDPMGTTGSEPSQFEKDIAAVINKHSVENDSNTPDFILAQYVRQCLEAFAVASRWREQWYGKSLRIGG